MKPAAQSWHSIRSLSISSTSLSDTRLPDLRLVSTRRPRPVSPRMLSRRRSPVEIWGTRKNAASFFDWVPLPEPGGPRSTSTLPRDLPGFPPAPILTPLCRVGRWGVRKGIANDNVHELCSRPDSLLLHTCSVIDLRKYA